jgi:hypothetical protein
MNKQKRRVITVTFPPDSHFEIRKGRRVIVSTEYPECIPDKDVRTSLRKAGYSLYMNGHPYKETHS